MNSDGFTAPCLFILNKKHNIKDRFAKKVASVLHLKNTLFNEVDQTILQRTFVITINETLRPLLDRLCNFTKMRALSRVFC